MKRWCGSLVDKGANISKEDECKDTALHRAARNSHIATMQQLVDAGNADITATNKENKTALFLAVENGHRDAAIILFQNQDIEHEDGTTPRIDKESSSWEALLLRTAKYGDNDVAQLLLDKEANVDAKDRND